MRYEWIAKSSYDRTVENLVRGASMPVVFIAKQVENANSGAIDCIGNDRFENEFGLDVLTSRVIDAITKSAMLQHAWFPCDEDLEDWACFRILRLRRNSFVLVLDENEMEKPGNPGVNRLLDRFKSLQADPTEETISDLVSQVEFERILEHDIAHLRVFQLHLTLLHLQVHTGSADKVERFFQEVQARSPIDGHCYRHTSDGHWGISLVSGWSRESALEVVQTLAASHFHDPELRFSCGIARRRPRESIGRWTRRAITQLTSPWDERLQSSSHGIAKASAPSASAAPLAAEVHRFPVHSVTHWALHEQDNAEQMVLNAFDETLFLVNALLVEIGRSPRDSKFHTGSWMSQFTVFLADFMEREERHMMHTGYSDVGRHRLLHQGLLSTARRIENELYRKTPGAERRLVWFVVEQILGSHFAREDAPYYEWVQRSKQSGSSAVEGEAQADPLIDQRSA